MSKRKRIISFLSSLCLIAVSQSLDARSLDLASTSQSAILIDINKSAPLYEKNADQRLPMASTTKIMTAITALRFFTPDTEMTVPIEAVGTEGTSACLEEGEIYSLEELLTALLLQSANDAAVTIALNTAGSIDGFALLMNREARIMGLTGTNFTNPHGLPDEEHYTTARELATIAKEAMQNECISRICATKRAMITSETGKNRYFTNHNKMLVSYEGANGVKTGYTKSSGRCLVSSAKRGDVTLIAVTLHSHDDWREHTAMLDYGFDLAQVNN